jgi:hypothetical protein
VNLETCEHTGISNLGIMQDISVMDIRIATGLRGSSEMKDSMKLVTWCLFYSCGSQ